MAPLTVFAYRHGESFPHRMDVRAKLACLAMVGVSGMHGAPAHLTALTGLVLLAAAAAGIPMAAALRELRYFAILLTAVFLAAALSTPGETLFGLSVAAVTREGIRAGAVVCWRLSLVLLAGLVFVATTRPAAVRAAVEWFLRPVPGIPEKKAATMLGLMVRFVPLVFSQARATADAQRARGVEARRNPVYRVKAFAVPLIRRIFSTAADLAVAMEARCYSEKRTARRLSAAPADWLAVLLVGGYIALTRWS